MMTSGGVRVEKVLSSNEKELTMNWAEICFCMDLPPVAGRPDGLDCGRVSALLAETLFAGNRGMGDVLAARYRQMAANFLDMPFDDPRWDLDVGGRDLPHDAHDNAALLSVPANLLDGCAAPVAELLGHANFGHDMPTWMVRRGVENPLRVMIVSQDPRRTGHPAGSLVLSTPFGFHSRDYRAAHCQNANLCRLVERLLEADACVYLTDCMKFYTDDVVAGGRPPQNYVRANLRRYRGLFRAALDAEIAAYVPDVIVTLGNEAADFVGAAHPGKGLAPQTVNGRTVVATYHTSARSPVIRKLGFQSTQEYFNQVFATVAGVRRG